MIEKAFGSTAGIFKEIPLMLNFAPESRDKLDLCKFENATTD